MRTQSSVLVLLVLAVPGRAADEGLAWKWKEGETFYVRTVTTIEQKLVIEDASRKAPAPVAHGLIGRLVAEAAGIATNPLGPYDREVRQHFEHTTLLSYKVQKVNKDGSATVLQRVEGAAVRAPKDEVSKADPVLRGAELTLHVTSRGEVTKVEGADKLLEKLAGGAGARKDTLRAALAEESLRKSATQALGFLPPRGTRAGGAWQGQVELALGPLGRFTVRRSYRDAGEGSGDDKGLAHLAFTASVSNYRPEKTGKGGPRPSDEFQVTEGSLDGTGKGDLYFNAAAGRLVRAETSLKLQGRLTVHRADDRIVKDWRLRLTQEQTTRTTVMDKLPN